MNARPAWRNPLRAAEGPAPSSPSRASVFAALLERKKPVSMRLFFHIIVISVLSWEGKGLINNLSRKGLIIMMIRSGSKREKKRAGVKSCCKKVSPVSHAARFLQGNPRLE